MKFRQDYSGVIVDHKGITWSGNFWNTELAAFVVKACNAHYDLVEALREAKELLALNGINEDDTSDYGNGRADDIVNRINSVLIATGKS